MGIAPQFATATTLTLALVITVFAVLLLGWTRGIVEDAVAEARDQVGEATVLLGRGDLEFQRNRESARPLNYEVLGTDVAITTGPLKGQRATVYRSARDKETALVVAPTAHKGGDPVKKLYGLFFGFTAIALLAAGIVALVTANKVARPISNLVNDVRTIANGNLDHRVRARGGGEVGLLASAIDRMTVSLRDAQHAEVELSVREREREVALEIQGALHASTVSVPAGYLVASEQTSSEEHGGDFHASIETPDGRTIYFVCDISGTGVPGALVGAMARGYLKSTLSQGGALDEALKTVNRMLAAEMRKGTFVTVLAAALDPESHELEVASAGHKLPLVHWHAADGTLRTIHPEGIALGFDKGPVFERGLQTKRIPMEPGDRVLLTGVGAVGVLNADGEEIGEKRVYKLFSRNAADDPADALDGLLTALEAYAGDEPFPTDVSAIVLGRA